MIQRFDVLARRLARAAKAQVKTNDRLHTFLSDVGNASFFSDLSEHERMLADRVRVEAYAEAIERTVGPDDVVVDVGTGSGILALLAAAQGATVYAIDHADFIAVAEEIARRNGVDGIRFEQVHSRDFSCPEPVDVILHEQIGDDLFNEGMVENLLDLERRVLADDGQILPARFDLFFEPIAVAEEHHVPFLPDASIEGIDFSFSRDHPVVDQYRPDDYAQQRLEADAFDGFSPSHGRCCRST